MILVQEDIFWHHETEHNEIWKSVKFDIINAHIIQQEE
jgi:hypothetical protein